MTLRALFFVFLITCPVLVQARPPYRVYRAGGDLFVEFDEYKGRSLSSQSKAAALLMRLYPKHSLVSGSHWLQVKGLFKWTFRSLTIEREIKRLEAAIVNYFIPTPHPTAPPMPDDQIGAVDKVAVDIGGELFYF